MKKVSPVMSIGRVIRRNRRQFKRSPDPEADRKYYREYLKKAEDTKIKMQKFDELPPEVRRALSEAIMGGMSIDDIIDHLNAGMSPKTMVIMIHRTAAMLSEMEKRRFEHDCARGK
jgi:DNA-directed RNA polymerase specialized sigma24 family protein